jgi:DNA-binding transcriptional MerR regulator
MKPHLINNEQAAKLLGIRPQTLRLWRYRGTGPAYIRLTGKTGRVMYDTTDIAEWLRDRTHTCTSEESAP